MLRTACLLGLAACAGPVDGTLETHALDASGYRQTYTLTVFVPDGAKADTPVVYLFDGDDWTDDTASIVSRLARDGELRHAPYVVGIGYGDGQNQRARDYTPPGKGIPPGHGEVEAFYGFLQDDLVPWVDDRYSTDPTPEGRVVLGHSFGGVAALWGLFFAADTFGGAVALSPSLAFGGGAFFQFEADHAADHDDLVGRTYLAAGAAEAHGLAGLTEAFGATLDDRGYPGLALKTELLPGKIHSETFQPGAEAGLGFVLGAR